MHSDERRCWQKRHFAKPQTRRLENVQKNIYVLNTDIINSWTYVEEINIISALVAPIEPVQIRLSHLITSWFKTVSLIIRIWVSS